MEVSIRKGRKSDMEHVHQLIVELAEYEKARDEVVTSAKSLEKDFCDDLFDLFVAEEGEEIIGFALFYTSYSTWKGRCLYLEDFLVTESARGKGVGQRLFDAVVREARLSGVRRMDWQVLDWNHPAIRFYEQQKAIMDPEWINGRLFFEV